MTVLLVQTITFFSSVQYVDPQTPAREIRMLDCSGLYFKLPVKVITWGKVCGYISIYICGLLKYPFMYSVHWLVRAISQTKRGHQLLF